MSAKAAAQPVPIELSYMNGIGAQPAACMLRCGTQPRRAAGARDVMLLLLSILSLESFADDGSPQCITRPIVQCCGRQLAAVTHQQRQ
jgi:hypothetical protein